MRLSAFASVRPLILALVVVVGVGADVCVGVGLGSEADACAGCSGPNSASICCDLVVVFFVVTFFSAVAVGATRCESVDTHRLDKGYRAGH